MKHDTPCCLSDIKGEVISEVTIRSYNSQIEFVCESGNVYRMYHVQECCEDVYLESVDAPLDVITHSEVIVAEERIVELPDMTATFYIIGTVKGVCIFRWCGRSNGYYSETVEFFKEENE